jgi:hypothetical protein
MVTRTQQWAAAVLALGLAAGLYFWARSGPPSTASANGSAAAWPAGPPGSEPEVPRIDLARLESPKQEASAGRRDLFDYGVPPAPPPTPRPSGLPPPVTASSAPTGPISVPVPLPLLNVRYVGAIEDKRGLKVAVFLTDRDEVLTGQAGQVVGNRFRIIRIGLESVDIQEVGSDHTRRIALGGK